MSVFSVFLLVRETLHGRRRRQRDRLHAERLSRPSRPPTRNCSHPPDSTRSPRDRYRGHQIAVHAIGDGAVRTTIDGYEAAQRANGKRDSRHRIEHIELIDRADVPASVDGITASVQPGARSDGFRDVPDPRRDRAGPLGERLSLPRPRRGRRASPRLRSDGGDRHLGPARHPGRPHPADLRRGRAVRMPLADLRAYTATAPGPNIWIPGTLRPGMAAGIVVLWRSSRRRRRRTLAGMGVALTAAGGQVTHRADHPGRVAQQANSVLSRALIVVAAVDPSGRRSAGSSGHRRRAFSVVLPLTFQVARPT